MELEIIEEFYNEEKKKNDIREVKIRKPDDILTSDDIRRGVDTLRRNAQDIIRVRGNNGNEIILDEHNDEEISWRLSAGIISDEIPPNNLHGNFEVNDYPVSLVDRQGDFQTVVNISQEAQRIINQRIHN